MVSYCSDSFCCSRIDKDRSGSISANELGEALSNGKKKSLTNSPQKCTYLVEEMQWNNLDSILNLYWFFN